MNSELELVETTLRSARSVTEVFGSSSVETARPAYLRLVKIVHPDAGGSDAVFLLLQQWWAALSEGKVKPSAGYASATRSEMWSVSSPTSRYHIVDSHPVKAGGFRLWRAQWDAPLGAGSREGVLATVGMEYRDVARNMAATLSVLNREASEAAGFFPTFVERFAFRDGRSARGKTAVVYERHDGLVSLRDVKRAYPDGINARDAAWMFRKLLFAVGVASDCSIIHGGITPDTVYIHPGLHGLVLEGWGSSVRVGELSHGEKPTVAVVDSSWKLLYPEEIVNGWVCSTGSDVFMATKIFEWLTSSSTLTRELQRFVLGMTENSARSRHSVNPWTVRDDFTGLIERLWGPRKWRDFTVPVAK